MDKRLAGTLIKYWFIVQESGRPHRRALQNDHVLKIIDVVHELCLKYMSEYL
jgi:hypothetical protein